MNIFKKTSRQKKKRSPSIYVLLLLTFVLVLSSAFWAADTLTTVTLPQTGEPIALYSNQTRDDLRGTLVAGIKQAKESVLLIIYSLTDQQIIAALRQKAQEGVAVTVICDPKASAYVPRKLGKDVKVHKRYANGLMHQKILVIDGLQSWIGSANMTNESLRVHGNLIMGVNSVELAEKILYKSGLMQLKGEQPPVPHCNLQICGQESELWFLPDDKDAVSAILELIQTAQKTIRVAMFTFTRYDFTKALIEAQKRGVDTAVVIDNSSGKGASAKVVKMLQEGGVPTSLSQGQGLLHHKFMYIDGKTLVNGSANWTLAAFTKNDDCFMILRNLTDVQEKHMDKLWEAISEESH